jgi:hypothetical protein
MMIHSKFIILILNNCFYLNYNCNYINPYFHLIIMLITHNLSNIFKDFAIVIVIEIIIIKFIIIFNFYYSHQDYFNPIKT